MIYKKFKDLELSSLGLGMMRLPTVDGNDSDIDEKAAAEIIYRAREGGINYFDTAYGYHGGMSEKIAAGKILSRYPRDSYFLASKFPGYDLSNMGKIDKVFEEQLEKCNTDRFDFYLFHNVYEKNVGPYLDDEKYGLMSYLLRQKEKGRIGALGFSVHGAIDVLKRFLDKYGDKMEFCQIQLNYLDWNFQDAKAKVEELKKWGIPVWVMEPLRGGKLASLPQNRMQELEKLRPGVSAVQWAFRFIQSFEDVGVTLSGMSNLQQLEENIKIFSEKKALDKNEFESIVRMADEMTRKDVLPCTACRYCVSKCPQGLDIPRLIELYNEHIFTGGGFMAPMAVSAMQEDKRPGACVGCKSCETVCPQGIKISEAMSDFAERLGE